MAKKPQNGKRSSARTNDDGVARLVTQARENPQFFHDLVFSTEKTIGQLGYLSRAEKAKILAVDPDRLVAGLAGGVSPGDVEVCGVSCGGSCGGTCVSSCVGSCGASCGASCNSSCGGTCGGSCGASCDQSCADSCVASCVASGDLQGRDDWVTLPESALSQHITQQIRVQVERQSFSRFRR